MIQTTIHNLTNEEILQQIEKEIAREKFIEPLPKKQKLQKSSHKAKVEQVKLYEYAVKIGKILQKNGLGIFAKKIQKLFKLYPQNRTYILHDFIKFHDTEFVINLYNLFFYRNPSPKELDSTLLSLRSGKLSKSEIVINLYYSKEAREQNIVILGVKKRYLIMLLYKIPLLGYVIKLLHAFLTLPRLLVRIRSHENFFFSTIQAQEQKIQAQEHDQNTLHKEIRNLYKELEEKVSVTQMNYYTQTLHDAKEYMRDVQKNMQELIMQAKQHLPQEELAPRELTIINEEQKHIFDTFYVAFEERFRGSREAIKKRVSQYLPYVENLPFVKEQIKILDVGCGRGEWLELLKENAYEAKGIDLNRLMVKKSQALSLAVEEADVIEYLRAQPDASLSFISGFHIIEHLSFEVLMTLLQESRRVLQKGGMVLFETPNPENLVVGACTFYTDPTHINPLVPNSVEFLLQYNGFLDVEILRVNGSFEVDLQNDFLNLQFNPQFDYAVIGYKA